MEVEESGTDDIEFVRAHRVTQMHFRSELPEEEIEVLLDIIAEHIRICTECNEMDAIQRSREGHFRL